MSQPFRLIAAKGMQNGIFRLWYGAADNDQSPFVLTLTPQYVAHALRKALPVTLEETRNMRSRTRTGCGPSRMTREHVVKTPRFSDRFCRTASGSRPAQSPRARYRLGACAE
jgi:hypothetical protein